MSFFHLADLRSGAGSNLLSATSACQWSLKHDSELCSWGCQIDRFVGQLAIDPAPGGLCTACSFAITVVQLQQKVFTYEAVTTSAHQAPQALNHPATCQAQYHGEIAWARHVERLVLPKAQDTQVYGPNRISVTPNTRASLTLPDASPELVTD